MRKRTMKATSLNKSLLVMAAITAAGAAHGANIVYGTQAVGGVNPTAQHVTVNTTWTSDNVYYLTDPVFVKDGATLPFIPAQ